MRLSAIIASSLVIIMGSLSILFISCSDGDEADALLHASEGLWNAIQKNDMKELSPFVLTKDEYQQLMIAAPGAYYERKIAVWSSKVNYQARILKHQLVKFAVSTAGTPDSARFGKERTLYDLAETTWLFSFDDDTIGVKVGQWVQIGSDWKLLFPESEVSLPYRTFEDAPPSLGPFEGIWAVTTSCDLSAHMKYVHGRLSDLGVDYKIWRSQTELDAVTRQAIKESGQNVPDTGFVGIVSPLSEGNESVMRKLLGRGEIALRLEANPSQSYPFIISGLDDRGEKITLTPKVGFSGNSFSMVDRALGSESEDTLKCFASYDGNASSILAQFTATNIGKICGITLDDSIVSTFEISKVCREELILPLPSEHGFWNLAYLTLRSGSISWRDCPSDDRHPIIVTRVK